MKTSPIKFSQILANQGFFSSRTPTGYVCTRLSETYYRRDGSPVNAVVLTSDDLAQPTLAHFEDHEAVWLIDSKGQSLISVMAEVEAARKIDMVLL